MSAASLLVRGLNHLLEQNPGSTGLLSQHAGQHVRIDLGFNQVDLQIADDGYLIASATTSPDALLRATPELITRLPFMGRAALRHADYSGDAALLQTLDKAFHTLRWDIEAELAPLLGDMVAHRIGTASQQVLRALRQAGQSLGTSASEYVVEEIELVAREHDVARFNHAVDALVDDASRLEARLAQIESSMRLAQMPRSA